MSSVTGDDEQIDCCPICLEESDDQSDPQQRLVSPPCGHAACRSCFEQVLLVNTISPPGNANNHDRRPANSPTNGSCVPTLGTCPLCRASVYLFDLIDPKSGDIVYPKEPVLSLPDGFRDAVYSDPIHGIGFASWHFGTDGDNDDGDNQKDAIFLNLSGVEVLSGQDPQIKLQDAHFHSASRTLAGHLPFVLGQYERWDIYLSFSDDYSFIRAGLIHKLRKQLDQPELVRKRYPLDGTWTVSGTTESSVVVEGMIASWQEGHDTFVLRIDRESNAITLYDNQGLTIKAVAEFNWTDSALGPEVGEAIVWKFPGSNLPWRMWTRRTISTFVPPDEFMYIGGSSQRTYRRVNVEPRVPPSYNSTSVWGNVFCQELKVGLASYHFVSPDAGVYISYEHPATARWPPLDNGAPVPARVFFRNVQIDDTSFHGSILWQQDYGTTWQGMAEWNYEVVFDSRFTCILSGRVLSRRPHDDSLPTEMSRYGENLVYVNAAIFAEFLHELLDESFADASLALPQRLLGEGGSVRTISVMHRLLVAAQSDQVNPVDLNL